MTNSPHHTYRVGLTWEVNKARGSTSDFLRWGQEARPVKRALVIMLWRLQFLGFLHRIITLLDLTQQVCEPTHVSGPTLDYVKGGSPRVVVSTAAFHARVWGSVSGLGGLKKTEMFLTHPRVKVSIVGSLRDREVACSASDRQGSNFESCVWRTVSYQSSHHPQEVLLTQFNLCVHKGGLKPDSFHFIFGLCDIT